MFYSEQSWHGIGDTRLRQQRFMANSHVGWYSRVVYLLLFPKSRSEIGIISIRVVLGTMSGNARA